MLKIYIPAVGDKVVVTEDKSLNLSVVGDNEVFSVNVLKDNSNIKLFDKHFFPLVLTEGTVLTVEKVFVRAGYSSTNNGITFRSSSNKNLPNGRFTIPLDEVNKLGLEAHFNLDKPKSVSFKNHLLKIISSSGNTIDMVEAIDRCYKIKIKEFDIYIDTQEVMQGIWSKADEVFMSSLGVSYKDATLALKDRLEHDSISIDSLTAKASKEGLKAIEIGNPDNYLDNDVAIYDRKVPIAKLTHFKVAESEQTQLRDPYVLSVRAQRNESNSFKVIRTLTSVINYILIKSLILNSKNDDSIASNYFRVLDTLINLPINISMAFRTHDKYYLRTQRIDNEMLPDVYLNQDDIKHFDLLNPEASFNNGKHSLTYTLNGDEISCKKLRRVLTLGKRVI